MSQFIPCKVSWTDNSSGDRDELGTEIDIYTDSPSFVPNVPVDPASGVSHAWMRLPAVAAAEVSAEFRLETPVTFIRVRVRQYNAYGPGEWDAPAGTTFTLAQTAGPLAPPAVSAVGFVVTDAVVVPPPPVDPPPPPPPTGGGGTSSNYSFAVQFSGVQGESGWRYKDSSGAEMTYNAADAKWSGNELYLAIWSGGFRHSSSGSIKDAVLEWTAPANGTALVSGTAGLFSAPGSVRFIAKHGSTVKFTSSDMTTTVAEPYSFSAVMTAGEKLTFISQRVSSTIYNNNVSLNPVINFTTDGTTPALPSVSSLSPSSLTLSVGGIAPLTVTLSSAPASAASVAMVSSDPTKATVPATVTVPAGQTTAVVSVTGVAAGATTVTATYNSSNKASSVAVSNPASGTWSNAPAGGTVLFDSALNSLTGLIDDYPPSSTPITIPDAPFSPSMGIRHRLEALAKEGGGQVRYRSPVLYREMYAGMYWRSNPQFQGRTAGNKVFFLRGIPGSNGVIYWFGPRAAGGGFTAPLIFSMNGQTENKHILGPASDSGSAFGHNVGNSTVVAGVWYKLEWRIRCSTTLTSQDGILQMWLNGVLTHSYLNINYSPHGLNEWVMNQTWDGSGDMGVSNTMAWEYYLDHLIIVGKN